MGSRGPCPCHLGIHRASALSGSHPPLHRLPPTLHCAPSDIGPSLPLIHFNHWIPHCRGPPVTHTLTCLFLSTPRPQPASETGPHPHPALSSGPLPSLPATSWDPASHSNVPISGAPRVRREDGHGRPLWLGRTANRSRIYHQFKRDRPRETLSRTGSKKGGRTGDLPPQEEEPLARSRASAENPGDKGPQCLSRAPLKSTFKTQGGLCPRGFPTGKLARVQRRAAQSRAASGPGQAPGPPQTRGVSRTRQV